jgi:hypothetical protein
VEVRRQPVRGNVHGREIRRARGSALVSGVMILRETCGSVMIEQADYQADDQGRQFGI